MYYSHFKSGQPGPITRVMCCDEKQTAQLDKNWLDLGPTHLAPSFTHNPHNDDHYSAYNKPLAVIDFIEKFQPEEDWILFVDADMLIRLPFLCKGEDNGDEDPALEMPCARGHPISAYYGYLIGVTNHLAVKHLPNVKKREDTDGGQPRHRLADQCGGMLLVHKDDIKQYMHDWLKITEDVRFDPEAWKLSGDVFAAKEPGSRPWISEMYGYVFSAAKHDMWHTIDRTSMIYPGYWPAVVPRLMHYGLEYSVLDYKFDKHWHYDFDPMKCPPWGDVDKRGNTVGVFKHPPHPSKLPSTLVGMERLKDLLATDTVNTLNEAMCWFHERHCPGVKDTEDFKLNCGRVNETAEAVRKELIKLDSIPTGQPGSLCVNQRADKDCERWASTGDCNSNAGFMASACPKACGICRPVLPRSQLFDLPGHVLPGRPARPSKRTAVEKVPDLTTSPDPAPTNDPPAATGQEQMLDKELTAQIVDQVLKAQAAIKEKEATASPEAASKEKNSPSQASPPSPASEEAKPDSNAVKSSSPATEPNPDEDGDVELDDNDQSALETQSRGDNAAAKSPADTDADETGAGSDAEEEPAQDAKADAVTSPDVGDDGNVDPHGAQTDPESTGVQPGSKADREPTVTSLQHDCLQRQDLSAAQVQDCLRAASLRQAYEVPRVPVTVIKAQHVDDSPETLTVARRAAHGLDNTDASNRLVKRWRMLFNFGLVCVAAWALSVATFLLLAKSRRRKRAARTV